MFELCMSVVIIT